MFFDMLDGRVARLTRNTSSFGGQLDSLADVVTFGVAPAFLVITIITKYLHREMSVMPVADDYFGSRGLDDRRGVCVLRGAAAGTLQRRARRGRIRPPQFSRLAQPPAPGRVLASLVLLRASMPAACVATCSSACCR